MVRHQAGLPTMKGAAQREAGGCAYAGHTLGGAAQLLVCMTSA